MKNYLYLFIIWLCIFQKAQAQEEKLLYSTDFQDWAAVSSSGTETVVTKTTNFSAEQLDFKILKVAINPTGVETNRFNYDLVNVGWAMADKAADPYIELSPLTSVTKVVFTHGATGSNRGYGLWKKSEATNNEWVSVSSSVANPASGTTVTVNINDTNVALRFTNLNSGQNAYMFDLKIYGNYTPSGTQFSLSTGSNIIGAGTVTKSPDSEEYTEESTVNLQAIPNFGYKFLKWVDAANGDAELSTSNPYIVTIDAAKNIKAIFEAVNTYNFTLNVVGSNWGDVQLSPAPISGKYEEGTEVLMKIIPNPVTTFSYWDDNSTVTERTIVVNSDKTITATFDEIPFIVGWNFKNQDIKQSKQGDYYSETTNVGSISVHEPSGAKVNWLSNAGSFSPSYPNIRLWTAGANFKTQRRYVQAQFSTTGYKNISIKSMVSANYQAYSIMTLQYSLDGTSFTEIGRTDITGVHNTSWADLNVTLPEEAEDKSMVYIRWIADETSPIINEGSDNDGAALTNVYVFADKEITHDDTPPVLVSSVPVSASNTASVNGAVVLTFNEKVKAGTGDVTLGTKVLTGVFGAKTATFAYEKLSYDTEYTFTVPAGALTDMSGNNYEGIAITFRTGTRAEPVKKLFDAVVAQDGSGDYLSVIEAIAAAPANNPTPWVIFIKNGTYTGHHDIPSTKPFIHLIGQSRDGVIIKDDRVSGTYSGKTNYHVSEGATMVVNSTNCYFENITFENSHGYELQTGPQALALYTNKDKFTMNNCYLRSYQDTYLTAGGVTDRHYVKNSKIEGAVDFIYGGGDVFFDKDTITVTRTGSYVVAPNHKTGTEWGYVFSNCILNEDRVSGAINYFGRPWQNSPKTVFINTKLLTGINPAGWYYKMGAIPVVFADYGTMDANGNPVDISQRISNYEYDNDGTTVTGTAKNSLTDIEAAAYTYENVILRSGDSWDPRMIAEAPEQPVNVKIENAVLTWDATAYTRLYVVTRDNKVIGFSLTNGFTDATAVAGTNYTYKVQAASEYGALSIASESVETLPITGLQIKATKINQSVQINWSTITEKGTSHFIIERTLDGKKFEEIGRKQSTGNSDSKQEYFFTDNSPASGTNIYRIKAVDFDGYFEYSELVAVKFAEDTDIKIYPNPASKQIRVSSGREISSLSVYDLSGRKVLHIENPEETQPIDISSLSAGVYIIEVYDSTSKSIVRFIKN